MPAYIIAEVEITDPVAYERYKPLAAAAIARHGGRYLVRGGRAERLEGEGPLPRIVILEFPSYAAAEAFYRSAEYTEAARLRQAAARSRLTLLDGQPPG